MSVAFILMSILSLSRTSLSVQGDFEELSAHESSLKIRLSESNTKLSEGDISRTVLEDDATSLKVQIERMAMEIQDLQTREIERESLHESQVQGLQQQLVVAAQAKNLIRSGAIERDDSEEEDAHYPVTDEIHLQMVT